MPVETLVHRRSWVSRSWRWWRSRPSWRATASIRRRHHCSKATTSSSPACSAMSSSSASNARRSSLSRPPQTLASTSTCPLEMRPPRNPAATLGARLAVSARRACRRPSPGSPVSSGVSHNPRASWLLPSPWRLSARCEMTNDSRSRPARTRPIAWRRPASSSPGNALTPPTSTSSALAMSSNSASPLMPVVVAMAPVNTGGVSRPDRARTHGQSWTTMTSTPRRS